MWTPFLQEQKMPSVASDMDNTRLHFSYLSFFYICIILSLPGSKQFLSISSGFTTLSRGWISQSEDPINLPFHITQVYTVNLSSHNLFSSLNQLIKIQEQFPLVLHYGVVNIYGDVKNRPLRTLMCRFLHLRSFPPCWGISDTSLAKPGQGSRDGGWFVWSTM